MTSADPARTPTPQVESTTDDEVLPTFSEQVAQQLGGVHGMIESSIPVLMFVIVNIIWSLVPAVIVSVVAAVGIAAYRLLRKEPVRHAVNGLLGIAIGATIAFRTGKPEDFYIWGIILAFAYGIAMIISVVMRRPLVGWLWSIVADKGLTRWYDDIGLRRSFGWLTLVWAATYLVKAALQLFVWYSPAFTSDEKATILGVLRIALGAPPYALLLALTIWAVRPHLRRLEPHAVPDAA